MSLDPDMIVWVLCLSYHFVHDGAKLSPDVCHVESAVLNSVSHHFDEIHVLIVTEI